MKIFFLVIRHSYSNMVAKVLVGLFVSALLVACSEKKSESTANSTANSTAESTAVAATDEPETDFDSLARATINNGFYLSLENEYSADGSLLLSNRYDVDFDVRTITSTNVAGNASNLNALYTFSTAGDLQTITYYAERWPDQLDDTVVLIITVARNNGVLSQVDVDYQFGAENDRVIQFFYDNQGRIARAVDTNLVTQKSFNADYFYNADNLLSSIEAEDEELPDTIVESLFTWNSERQLVTENFKAGETELLMTYDYNTDGNVATITTTGVGGEVVSIYEYTYVAAMMPVFNIIAERLYYQ